jgi:hypothetical protein
MGPWSIETAMRVKQAANFLSFSGCLWSRQQVNKSLIYEGLLRFRCRFDTISNTRPANHAGFFMPVSGRLSPRYCFHKTNNENLSMISCQHAASHKYQGLQIGMINAIGVVYHQ